MNLNLSSAPIIYAKSAALLYYFSHVIGLNKFQEAINQYFKNSVINAKIIGDVFQKYNIADSISFSNLITNWILNPSFPLVEVFQKTTRKIIIKQSQFSPIGFEENNIWNIPIKIGIIDMNDDLILENLLLKDPEIEFKIPIKYKFVKLNWGQEGYYRIKYNNEIKKKLYNNIQNNNLTPEDRFGIHNDMIALVYAGKISLKDYLFDIETFFSNESHFFPLEDMLHSLNNLFVLCQESRDEISFVGSKICENFILRTNFFNLDKLNPNYEKLKNTLILSGFYFQIDDILSRYYWRIEDFYSNLVKSKNFPLNAFLYSLHRNSNLQNDIIRNFLDSNYKEEEAPQLLNALAFIKNFNKIKIIIFQLTKMKNLHALYTFLYDLSNNHHITTKYWYYIKKNITKIIDIFQMPLLGNFVVDIIPKVGIINIEEAISLLNLINDRIDNFDDVIDMSKDKLFLNFQLSIQK